MAYLGRQPVLGNFVKLDAITVVNGQAAYTMQNGGVNFTDYTTVNQFLVSLNGTIQAATDSFTVSGSTITFASNLSTGDVIDFIIVFGNSLSAGTVSDSAITTAKLANSAVDLTSKVTGTLPVANGGTNLTSGFKNGITEANFWRMTTAHTAPGTITNWEEADTYSPGKIGTGMSESSGIFSFPSTGIYLINFTAYFQANVIAQYVGARIYTTTDNSSYNETSSIFHGIGRDTYFGHLNVHYIFDVTNTSTHKLKFESSKSANTITFQGDTNRNFTYAYFLKLGDT